MAFDKGKYDQEYNREHIRRKFIPFNDTNKEDVELLAWLDQQGNVTQYIKRLIAEDIKYTKAKHRFKEAQDVLINSLSLSNRLSNENDNPQDD